MSTALQLVLAQAHAAPRREPLLTGSQLAKLLGRSPACIHRWARDNGVPVVLLGSGVRDRRYRWSEVCAWLDHRRQPQEQSA